MVGSRRRPRGIPPGVPIYLYSTYIYICIYTIYISDTAGGGGGGEGDEI